MKLVLESNLRAEIIDLIESGEIETWYVVDNVEFEKGTAEKALVHATASKQYDDICLRLRWNNIVKKLYIQPYYFEHMDEDDFFDKSCVVLGRFAEFLNKYFAEYDYNKTK